MFITSGELESTGFFVCGGSAPKLRRMPNAYITYRNFWADTLRAQLYQGFIDPADPNCGREARLTPVDAAAVRRIPG